MNSASAEHFCKRSISLVLNGLGDRAEAIVHAEDAYEIYKKVESPHSKKVFDQLSEWRTSS
jgi:hypothetical protein